MCDKICTGIDENAVGACSELIFAPINEMFPDDAPLVPSGFRVIPVDAKTVLICLCSILLLDIACVSRLTFFVFIYAGRCARSVNR